MFCTDRIDACLPDSLTRGDPPSLATQCLLVWFVVSIPHMLAWAEFQGAQEHLRRKADAATCVFPLFQEACKAHPSNSTPPKIDLVVTRSVRKIMGTDRPCRIALPQAQSIGELQTAGTGTSSCKG